MLKIFVDSLEEFDIFRFQYPNTHSYTWKNKAKEGLVQLRLHMLFVSNNM